MGCKKVAGGRSSAKTTGKSDKTIGTLKGCQTFVFRLAVSLLHPFRVLNILPSFRWSSTTGYFLEALRAAFRESMDMVTRFLCFYCLSRFNIRLNLVETRTRFPSRKSGRANPR